MFVSKYSAVEPSRQTGPYEQFDAHHLIELGNIEDLNFFLKMGGDVNQRDDHGNTLLHTAVDQDNDSIADLLLEHPDIDTDALNDNGETALFSVQSEKMLDILMFNCFDQEVKNENGYFPIHLAAFHARDEVVVALIKHYRVNPSQSTSDGITPMHLAAQQNHYELVDILLQLGGKVDAQTSTGHTPLHFAARAGHTNMRTASKLLGHHGNARYNLTTIEGKTALDLALETARENRGNSREHLISEVGTCILFYQQKNAAKIRRITSSISFPKTTGIRVKRPGSPLVPEESKKRKKR